MGNDHSKPRIKNKGKINSTTATPVRIVSQHVQSPAKPGTFTGVVTQESELRDKIPIYQVTLDSSIFFFDTVRQIAEATELLAPLKAVCGAIIKALEITRAVHANKDEWANLMDKIRQMYDTIGVHIDRLQRDEKRSHIPLLTDPALVEPLKRFIISLGEIFEARPDALKKGSKPVNHILTVHIDVEHVQQYKEALNSNFNDCMAAITIFTAHYTKEQGSSIFYSKRIFVLICYPRRHCGHSCS
ncbi:hypothetical protein M408DRAFT_200992 [Serendipita vermifera MAFF 305830]|uniref:Uncharacterized protein n=1 Tax=Serendipita vermifera MAFF 305830 TaxID=933852 RepID=A0A0C2WHI2_SERVB|nr:hypothetical protein M408DRAFT_200992 [Serendipita vermifera MAFF 305830]